MAEAAEAAGLDAAAADADGDAAAAAGEPREQAGEPAEAVAAPVPAPVDAPQLQQAKSEVAADDEGAADWELGQEDLELDLTDHCEAGLEPGSGSGGQRCPELKRCNVCLRDLPLAQYPQNRDGSVRGPPALSTAMLARACKGSCVVLGAPCTSSATMPSIMTSPSGVRWCSVLF